MRFVGQTSGRRVGGDVDGRPGEVSAADETGRDPVGVGFVIDRRIDAAPCPSGYGCFRCLAYIQKHNAERDADADDGSPAALR